MQLPAGLKFMRQPKSCVHLHLRQCIFCCPQSFRAVERGSISTRNKAELVKICGQLSEMAMSMKCEPERQYRRGAVEQTTRPQQLRRYMPGLPPEREWLGDLTELRQLLPDIGEHVILTHLCETRGPGDYGARNVYRGAQRAWDGGGLNGFGAVLSPPEGGDLWLRLR